MYVRTASQNTPGITHTCDLGPVACITGQTIRYEDHQTINRHTHPAKVPPVHRRWQCGHKRTPAHQRQEPGRQQVLARLGKPYYGQIAVPR